MSILNDVQSYIDNSIGVVFGPNAVNLAVARRYQNDFKNTNNVILLLSQLNKLLGRDFIFEASSRGVVIPKEVAIYIDNEQVANGQTPTTLTSLTSSVTAAQELLGFAPFAAANIGGSEQNPLTVMDSINQFAQVIGTTAVQAGRFARCDFDAISAKVQAEVAVLRDPDINQIVQAIANALGAGDNVALINIMKLDFELFGLNPSDIQANIANMNNYNYEQYMPSSFENYDASVLAAKIYLASGLWTAYYQHNPGYNGPFWASSVKGLTALMNDINALTVQGVDIGDIVAKIVLETTALQNPNNQQVATQVAQALVDVAKDNSITISRDSNLIQYLRLDLDSMGPSAGADLVTPSTGPINSLSGSSPSSVALNFYAQAGYPDTSSINSMNMLSAALTADNINQQIDYSTLINEMKVGVNSLTNVTLNSIVSVIANVADPVNNMALVNAMLTDLGWWWYGEDATSIKTAMAQLKGADAPSITVSLYEDVFQMPFISFGNAISLLSSAVNTDMLTNKVSNTTIINNIVSSIKELPLNATNYNISVAFANAINAGDNVALIKSMTAELDTDTVFGMPSGWVQYNIDNLQGIDGPSIVESFFFNNRFYDINAFKGFDLLTASILKPCAPTDITTSIGESSVVVASLGDFYSCTSTSDVNPTLIASGANSISGTALANKQCDLWGYDHSRASIYGGCNHIYVSATGAGGCFQLTPGSLQTLPVNITSVVHPYNYFTIPSIAVTYDGCLKTVCTNVTEVVYEGCAATMHIPRLYVDKSTYMTSPTTVTVWEAGEDRSYTIPALEVVGASSTNAGDLAAFCQMMIDH